MRYVCCSRACDFDLQNSVVEAHTTADIAPCMIDLRVALYFTTAVLRAHRYVTPNSLLHRFYIASVAVEAVAAAAAAETVVDQPRRSAIAIHETTTRF